MASNNMSANVSQGSHSAQVVKGVVISCMEDLFFSKCEKFAAIDVLISDPVFAAHLAPLSDMTGVPLRVCNLPHYPRYPEWGKGPYNDYENLEVASLFRKLVVSPDNFDFGHASFPWNADVGSVLVARDDGKDITPRQVEALCYYCGEHFEELYQGTCDDEDYFIGSKEKMVELAGLFTPEKFREFFSAFKAKKAVDDSSWATVASPV